MKSFVPKEKMGKKARRALNAVQRRTWAVSPVTRKSKNPKAYARKALKSRPEEDGFYRKACPPEAAA